MGHERFLPSSACPVVTILFQLSSYRGKHPGGYITLLIPKAQLLQCGLTFSPSHFSPLQSLVALLKYSCRAFLIKQHVVQSCKALSFLSLSLSLPHKQFHIIILTDFCFSREVHVHNCRRRGFIVHIDCPVPIAMVDMKRTDIGMDAFPCEIEVRLNGKFCMWDILVAFLELCFSLLAINGS